MDADLENDLLVRAEANELGDLKAVRLGEARVPDLATLGVRLRRYIRLLEGRPLRVRLVADDQLRVRARRSNHRDVRGRRGLRDPADPAGCHAASAGRRRTAGRHRRGRGRPQVRRSAMKPGIRFLAVLLMPALLVLACGTWSHADDSEVTQQLSLADLAAYRAALSGKATADFANGADPPARVVFKDLWNRPDRFRGRRVTIGGRISRLFRQGPVGSFPPMAEVWITSPKGNPFCVVFPQPGPPEGDDRTLDVTDQAVVGGGTSRTMRDGGQDAPSTRIPELGSTVRFTGTFLKMVRYAAADGVRLAPLVVGDRVPIAAPSPADADLARSSAENADALRRALGGSTVAGDHLDRWSWSLLRWVLGLARAAAVASILVQRHLRSTPRRAGGVHAARSRRTSPPFEQDLPLEFIEPRDEL